MFGSTKKLLNRGLIIAGCRLVGREMKNGMQARRDESQIASLPLCNMECFALQFLVFYCALWYQESEWDSFLYRVWFADSFWCHEGGLARGGVLLYFMHIQTFYFQHKTYFLRVTGTPTEPPPSKIPHKSFYKSLFVWNLFSLRSTRERKEDSRYVSIKWHHSAFVWKFKLKSLSANKVDCRVSSKKRKRS